MVLFYNVLDVSTIAARVVWSMKCPSHPLSKSDARQLFIVRVAEQFVLDHMRRRLNSKNMRHSLKYTMQLHIGELEKKAAASEDNRRGGPQKRKRSGKPAKKATEEEKSKQGRCGSCTWKRDRKSRKACSSCCSWVCKEHSVIVCKECADSVTTVSHIYVAN
jgi:hypothetical protein